MNWIDEKMKEFKMEGVYKISLRCDECSYGDIADDLEPWLRTELQKAYDFGYSQAVIKTEKRLEEARTQGAEEALAKVEEWVKENKLDNVWVPATSPLGGIVCRECEGQEECECAPYNEALEKVLHHLQQLKDNKV